MRWLVRLFLFLLGVSALLSCHLEAAAPPMNRPEPPIKFTRLPRPNDAATLALADLLLQPAASRPFIRYLRILDADPEKAQSASFLLNAVLAPLNQSVITKPVPLGRDRLLILRVNLALYCPDPADLSNAIKTWEDLQFSPRFNLLVTRDTINLLNAESLPKIDKWEEVLVDCDPYVQNGKRFTQKWTWQKKKVAVKDAGIDLVRFAGRHLDPRVVADLVEQTQSQAPIIDYDYFTVRAGASIKDKGVFAAIYGGRYYEFTGVKTNAVKGATDLDVYLETLGIGNVKEKIDFRKLFDRLKSDQKIAMFRSAVTGKSRAILILKGLQTQDGQSLVILTFDIEDQDIDVGDNAMMNLEKVKNPKAIEAIVEGANGLHRFSLFNGQGLRQDEAPFNVVVDHRIPSPFTKRLQNGISCWRCHLDESGWKPAPNQVQTLLGGYANVFGDRDNDNRNKTIPETLLKFAGQYQGDAELKKFPRGRADYANAVLQATGPWQRSKDQLNVVQLASQKVSDEWAAYWYEPVDAQKALRELGYDVPKAQAARFLIELCPPDPTVKVAGIVLDDPRFVGLAAGLSINRTDWDLIYDFIATRVRDPKDQEQKDKP